MTRALQLAKLGVCLAAIVALLSFPVFLHQMRPEVTAAIAHQDAQLAALEMKAGATLDAINRPCGAGHPCGTLAEANVLMRKGSDILVTTQLNENREAGLLDGQVTPLLAHADRSLTNLDQATADVHPLLLSATSATNNLLPIEANAAQLVDHLDTESAMSFADANALLTNPSVPKILANVAGMTDSGNKMLFTFNEVETKATHNYLHPSPNPFVRTWQNISPYALPAFQIGGAAATVLTR